MSLAISLACIHAIWAEPVGWSYRRTLIVNPVTSTPNCQIMVELNTTSFDYTKAGPEGGDIRFYNANGSELSYWIETWNATGTSKIWVEIPTSGTGILYMYYGNPIASPASNIKTTFIIGDDFNDMSLDMSTWTWIRGSPGNWDEGVTQEDWLMMKTLDGHIWWTGEDGSVLRSVVDLGDENYEAIVRVQIDPTEMMQQVNLVAYSNDSHNFRVCRVRQASHRVEFTYYYSNGGIADHSHWIGNTATDLLLMIRRIGKNYTGYFSLDGGDSWTEIHRYENVALSNNYIALMSSKDHTGAPIIDSFYDDVRVRKYVSEDPTVALGEETSQLSILSSPVTGISFTIDEAPATTIYAQWLTVGSHVVEMPEFHTVGDSRYYWDQWSDGNTSRTRTILLDVNTSLTAEYTGPCYELTVTSSPSTGVLFTIDGAPQTTVYSDWLLEGPHTIVMPSAHGDYMWSHWLEDGDLNRVKTITLPGSTWTAVYEEIPVGGTSIGIQSDHPNLWATSILLIITLTVASGIWRKRIFSKN